MKNLKILTILGTRPEIIRLSRVMVKLDQYFDHILVHTGQNYAQELNEVFFEDLDLKKPDYFLSCTQGSKSAANAIGNLITLVDEVLEVEKPDAVLVLGDTNSCLAVIPAKRRQIPVFHMEAGNRCFDLRVPEEINRRIVDHTADINLTYSALAKEYLHREGLPPDQVINVGSPIAEVLDYYSDKIDASNILERLNLKPKEYFVVSAHREENVDNDSNFRKYVSVLNDLAEKYNRPVLVSTHPRTRKKIDTLPVAFHPQIRLEKPFGFFDYIKLQKMALVVLSDSGTISEESSILGFPALNLREVHERPEAMEEGAVMMVGFNLERVHQGIAILLASIDSGAKVESVSDYDKLNVSEKIAKIILSYIDFVNKRVWRKN